MNKILLAFDFDNTIVDGNSDTCIFSLFPNGKVPKDLQKMYEDEEWTAFMQVIFQRLHDSQVSQDTILDCVVKLPFTPGMSQFLSTLPSNKVDLIIISDSNTEFIQKFLSDNGLSNTFETVYTNPGKFDSSGLLTISVYHSQDWCNLSAKNICKGHVLASHIAKKQEMGIKYTHIGYVGDGTNDLCPSLRLRHEDAVFARLGYSLLTKIESMKKPGSLLSISAPVHVWESGLDLMPVVTGWCESLSVDAVPGPSRLLSANTTPSS